MKKTILFLLIAFFGWNEAITQSHPSDCQLPFDHNHNNTICFGYAMARAFGKDKLWPYNNTVYANPGEGVDTDYFQTDGIWFKSTDVMTLGNLSVNPASIIVFYNKKEPSGRVAQHASFVESVAPSGGSYQSDYLPAPLKRLAGGKLLTKDAAFYSANIDNIVMHQVPNLNGGFEEKTLRQVIDYWKTAGPYFRIFTANITPNIEVTYKNDFASTSGNGKIYFFSGATTSGGSSINVPDEEVREEIDVPSSGLQKNYFYGDKQKVGAFSPQVIAGNKYEFNDDWTAFLNPLNGPEQTLTILESGDVTAHFENSTTYTVQVGLVGDGENLDSYLRVGGAVTNVKGVTTAQYASGNPILEAYPYLVLYGVAYQFSQWNTGSTNTTITASPNGSYTAYYNFHSVNPPSSFRITSLPGDPGLNLRWNEMLSPYMTLLELWSKTKSTSYQLLDTLPDSATGYYDSRYSISTIGSQNDIGLEYQLKAKYVKPGVRTVWVQSGLFEWVSDDGIPPFERTNEEMSSITLKNDFGAYPNPFNPSVVLRVQLQEPAHVNLVIYDITGKTVRQPTNGVFNAGVHDFTWNTQENGSLPSGVYFAKVDLVPLGGGTPLQFVKKLMLSK